MRTQHETRARSAQDAGKRALNRLVLVGGFMARGAKTNLV